MKTWMAVLVGVVIGVLAVVLGVRLNLISPQLLGLLGLPAPPAPVREAMCEATVKLSLVDDDTKPNKKRIVTDPVHPVCIAVGRSMNWEILSEGTATVTFKEEGEDGKTRGPFPRDLNNTMNKDRGIYAAYKGAGGAAPVTIKTLGAEELLGPWEYHVSWVLLDGTKVDDLDPVVCIRR